MENKAFAPDEDEPNSKGKHDEHTYENGNLEKEDLSTDIPSSPNKQEIIAIVHPEPPETNSTPVTDKATNKTQIEETEVKGNTKTTIDSKDSIKENRSTDENHNKTTHENGHAQTNNSVHVSDDDKIRDIDRAEMTKNQLESLPNGDAPDGNHTITGDVAITVPETVTRVSESKSNWYYFFILLFFLGFAVALTIGLIYGRD